MLAIRQAFACNKKSRGFLYPAYSSPDAVTLELFNEFLTTQP
jgi:hypothetical protein